MHSAAGGDRRGMDALVVGAGVAGCTAARLLAAAGMDTVLVERPGPVPEHHLAHERLDAVADSVDVTEVVLSFGVETPRRHTDPDLVISSRAALLGGLRAAAVAAGARLVPAEPARVDLSADLVLSALVAEQGAPEIVLDATGAAHAQGTGQGFATTSTWRGCPVGNEVLVHLTQPAADDPRALPVVVRVVPIATDLATVTVTVMAPAEPSLDAVTAVVRSADPRLADAAPVGALSVHPVNAAFAPESAVRGHVLVLGEAAGLVNPFTGDGIANAIRSAEIAATAVTGHRGDSDRMSAAYRTGLRSAFVGYFETARHAVRHYHLAWRILSSSARSEHPFFRQGHRVVLLGGAIAYQSVATRQRLPEAARTYLAPFTLSCNEVIVRTVGEEWPFLAMHTLGGRGYRGVRPATLFAGALMSGGDHPDVGHAPVAAAIELALLGAVAHTVPETEATPLRRGVDWRYASAVIAADYLLATATSVLTRQRPDLAAAFAGWLGDLVAARADGTVISLFESVFEFPARIAAHLAGADDETIAVLRRFGRGCGRLFLLAEDLGVLSGRRTRLDTTLSGMLASGLSGIPARFGHADEEEIRYRRESLIVELELARATELASVVSLLDALPEPRSATVLRHFARSLAEPGPGVAEASP
jgi:2-polyprenyl-6-methoxyphenol hydroxylase-like FAD-dependent oxidoreductase/geranylgeranyl pyrophosphate synthase